MNTLIRSRSISRLAAIGAAALLSGTAEFALAQRLTGRASAPVALLTREQLVAAPTVEATPAAPPMYRAAVGERAIYDVELKGQGVGTGSLEVLSRAQIDGHQTLHARLKLSGGVLFLKVDERFDSWFDPDRYFSRRFSKYQKELGKTKNLNYLISPEKRTVHETFSNDVDSLATHEPLDDVSMLFYARTLPLKIGEVDTIPRYFKTGRDVIIRVLRKETITVPAGKFNTIVVQPVITNAGGLFGQGGKAEVYLSDDAERNVVMIKTSIPLIGSVSLTLRELTAP